MKREICPFCGNRWVRSASESPIQCPDCRKKFYPQDELDQRISPEQQ